MKSETYFGLPLKCIHQIHAIFNQYPEIKKVIIYGSRATGQFKPGSDIDLCLDAKELNLTQLLKIENQLDDLLLPWKIDLSLKHKIDNPALLQHIKQFGLLFVDN